MNRSVLFGLAAVAALGLVAAAVAQTSLPPAAGTPSTPAPAPAGDAAAVYVDAYSAEATLTSGSAGPGKPKRIFIKGTNGGRELDEETIELMDQDRALGKGIAVAAARLRSARDEAERAELQQQIAAEVAQQFEVRQSIRERELEQLSAQIVRLRTLHDQRTAQKDRIVNDRVNQVLRDAVGLGWGDDAAGVGDALKFHWQGGGPSPGPVDAFGNLVPPPE